MNYTTHATLASVEKVFKATDKTIVSTMGLGAFAGFGGFGLLLTPLLALPILPMAVIAVIAKYFGWDIKVYEYFTNSEKKVTDQEKEKLLQETLKKQNAILKALKEKEILSKEKIQELLAVQKQLLDIITKLESDLAAA